MQTTITIGESDLTIFYTVEPADPSVGLENEGFVIDKVYHKNRDITQLIYDLEIDLTEKVMEMHNNKRT